MTMAATVASGDRREERREVRGVVGARIDDGQISGADQVRLGAGMRERRRVWSEHAGDQRLELDERPRGSLWHRDGMAALARPRNWRPPRFRAGRPPPR
jgi:hypothetical protein